MNNRDIVLAIDVGTQSCRALAFDATGRLLDRSRVAYEPPYVSPEPGWAEQDPEAFWRDVGEACQLLWRQGVVDPDSIASVCMTFQRNTVIHLGADDKPLRPAIVWLDQRRCGKPPEMPPHWRLLFTIAGARETVAHFQAESEANWVAEHQPDVHVATKRIVMLSGFVTLRMTGDFVDALSCQVGYLPFDFKRQAWAGPTDWKWSALAVERNWLPALIPPGQTLGTVSETAAVHTGIPAGTNVISGGSDKACEVIGCGCLEPHQACIGYGTTATLNVDSPKYVEPVRLVPPYPSVQSGYHNIEYQVFRGFWMVTWFKEQFAHVERQRAAELGVAPEVLLEELAAEVPPGCLGLTLQPFWTPGVRHPGPEGKGAMVGFGAVHKKPHMYRALLEGLAYELRSGRERIQKRTGVPITELTVCGGGSRSDLVLQIAADVFDLPARRPSYDEASGLGAAILGAVGAGLHPDLKSAVAAMTGSRNVFDPIRANVACYDELYSRVYTPLYARLQPLYKAIMDITGYPKAP
jgi:sugar (pentulose or hexulose) kinase